MLYYTYFHWLDYIVLIVSRDNTIVQLTFLNSFHELDTLLIQKYKNNELLTADHQKNGFISCKKKQLIKYLDGEATEEDIKSLFNTQIGTNTFEINSQKLKIINEIMNIPIGQLVSYGDISQKLFGSKKYSRVVGHVCQNNNVGIIFCCQRVISKNNKKEYYKWDIKIKKKLISLEKYYASLY